MGSSLVLSRVIAKVRFSVFIASIYSQCFPLDSVEASSAYLWTLFFLAQHHSSFGASSQPAALAILALAEAHTPSLPELSMLKARILKRGGDTIGAMKAMGEARALDGQDRFLNSKDAKYLIRADRVHEAEAVVGLFTKVRSLSLNFRAF